MQYLLLIYSNEAEYAKLDEATSTKMMAEFGAFTQSTRLLPFIPA